MDNELQNLFLEAEKVYPNSDVLKVYKKQLNGSNRNTIKKRLLSALKRNTTQKQH